MNAKRRTLPAGRRKSANVGSVLRFPSGPSRPRLSALPARALGDFALSADARSDPENIFLRLGLWRRTGAGGARGGARRCVMAGGEGGGKVGRATGRGRGGRLAGDAGPPRRPGLAGPWHMLSPKDPPRWRPFDDLCAAILSLLAALPPPRRPPPSDSKALKPDVILGRRRRPEGPRRRDNGGRYLGSEHCCRGARLPGCDRAARKRQCR